MGIFVALFCSAAPLTVMETILIASDPPPSSEEHAEIKKQRPKANTINATILFLNMHEFLISSA
jgi:hypothetical protein